MAISFLTLACLIWFSILWLNPLEARKRTFSCRATSCDTQNTDTNQGQFCALERQETDRHVRDDYQFHPCICTFDWQTIKQLHWISGKMLSMIVFEFGVHLMPTGTSSIKCVLDIVRKEQIKTLDSLFCTQCFSLVPWIEKIGQQVKLWYIFLSGSVWTITWSQKEEVSRCPSCKLDLIW